MRYNYKLSQISERGGSRYVKTRFYLYSRESSPYSRMNNKGIDLAMSGKLDEAGIVLSDLIKEDRDFFRAYNNLGVVFELKGEMKKAFEMYSKAFALSENSYVKSNIISFDEEEIPLFFAED